MISTSRDIATKAWQNNVSKLLYKAKWNPIKGEKKCIWLVKAKPMHFYGTDAAMLFKTRYDDISPNHPQKQSKGLYHHLQYILSAMKKKTMK